MFADALVTFYRSVSVRQCREQAGRGSTENWLLSFLPATGGKCSSEKTAPHRDIVCVFPKVLVLKWDHKTEDLTEEGISTEMVERIRAGGLLYPCLSLEL